MKYYIRETVYVGPNRDQHIDSNEYDITTNPPRTNMSGHMLSVPTGIISSYDSRSQ